LISEVQVESEVEVFQDVIEKHDIIDESKVVHTDNQPCWMKLVVVKPLYNQQN